jgi:chromosome segregation protein
MHIKQIELFGFKSFMDKAIVSFSTGICAVVGPNGCGKSNIVDAIRWVLGEQSAKQLRGKLMEEVIFSGANGRASLNFAEVSLVLSTEDGETPPPYHDYSEIMVTRRLFRSGDSEYLINNIPCRRMDVSRLFMDTGIGHRHYAIIEQGKISHVVESRPEDIRALIEEAAGITKFKVRKKAALRKIELTKQNLLRLGDIIAEVSRQLSSLKRQAQRASRYRKLKKEIKHLEIGRALYRYQQWADELRQLEKELRSREDAQSEQAAQLARLDAEITDRAGLMQHYEEKLQGRRETIFSIRNTIGSDENSLLHLQRQARELEERQQRLDRNIQDQENRQKQLSSEKTQLFEEQQALMAAYSEAETLSAEVNRELNNEKTKLHELTAQLDDWKGDLVDLLGEMARVRNYNLTATKRLEEVNRRQARMEQEYTTFHQEHASLKPQSEQMQKEIGAIDSNLSQLGVEENHLKQKIQKLERTRDEQVDELNSLESDYNQQNSQLQVLIEMEQSYAWFNDAVRSLLSAKETNELRCNIRGAVAEMLEVDGSYRQAVEAVLGGRLQALVVDSVADARVAMQHLKETGAGRNYFIPESILANVQKTAADTDGPVPLTDLVKARPGYEGVIRFLLANVMYFSDLEQALTWWESHPYTCVLVTAEGDLVAQDGTIWGGSQEQQISILQKQDERKRLETRVAEQYRRLKAEQSGLSEVEQELARAFSQLQTTQHNRQQFRDELLKKEKEQYRLASEQERFSERLAMLEMEKEQNEEEVSLLQDEIKRHERELDKLEESQQELEENLAEAKHQRQEFEDEVENLQEQATTQQVSLGALAEKKESARSGYERLLEYHAEGEQRLTQLQTEKESCQQQRAQLRREQEETQERLEQAHGNLVDEEEHLKTEEEDWREFERYQHELESNRLRLLQQDRQEEQEIQRLRQEIAELNLKMQYLIHQTQERYHLDLGKQTQVEQDEPLDMEKVERKLQRLSDQVARIGEVNLTAIEEYEEQQQRYEFLTGQRQDLVESLDGLKKAISRINRTTRRRFLQTLEAVNRKLAEVFPVLFSGGTGHLQLMDDRDPLEAGVEILAHPPGKRLTSMSLLSGGEKALAAAALLFSLYMTRPSPFCILDEVDAPLDDANIDRFIEVLKKISQDSQIIMVTHNKRTMEISDLLLGVTMEEPGISKIISVNLLGVSDSHG